MNDLVHSRDLLARVREAIRGGNFYVMITDNRHVGATFRALAAGLVLGGAGPTEVLLAEPDLVISSTGAHLWLAVLAVAKSAISAEDAATFLARLSGTPYRPLLASIRAGGDLLPIAADPDATAAFLDGIARGTCYALDPGAN